jgi:hypothetical protein
MHSLLQVCASDMESIVHPWCDICRFSAESMEWKDDASVLAIAGLAVQSKSWSEHDAVCLLDWPCSMSWRV